MGRLEQARTERVDAWLRADGMVLASSVRAARSVAGAHHAARRSEGKLAWPTPAIFAWDEWVRERWLERNREGLMLLNPLQEQTVWAQGIGASGVIDGSQHVGRLAQSAQQAYGLLAAYAPAELGGGARLGWSGDAAIFADWLTEFEARCRRGGMVSPSLLAVQLTGMLAAGAADPASRTPLLLVGFDRLLKSQEALLNAWGVWQRDGIESAAGDFIAAKPGTQARFYAAADGAQELEACVRWLRSKLAAEPASRLLVVAAGLQARRGALERALLDGDPHEGRGLEFEFSLGVPLAGVGVVRGALLLMRWISDPLTETEVDWLLASGYCTASAEEEIGLAETMRAIRARGLERPVWSLKTFCAPDRRSVTPPAGWVERLGAAQALLARAPVRQSPMEWVRLAYELLEAAGWPGFLPASSFVYQALRRWRDVLEECGSLGFDGATMEWAEFVSHTAAAAAGTIFAAESTDAPVQITEPLPSAGQLADGVWFMGAHAEEWPGRGQLHPLLPVALQREAGMPHATQVQDWHLARDATRRLLGSADEVVFSFARQQDGNEARPSRLVQQLAGEPADLPSEYLPPEDLPAELADGAARALTVSEVFSDASRIPFPLTVVAGGAGTLTRQSLCPFQAFATARLGAGNWEPAESGLSARQRGQLLHDVLHRVWGGAARGGISTHAELVATEDLAGFVRPIAEAVVRDGFADAFAPGGRNSLSRRFPERLLALEAERLTRLVAEWLAYERLRVPFAVAGTEREGSVRIAGLEFKVRLDRVDRLGDGSELVIDYKSSDVGPSAWRGERPDDVQLPLYATFAVEERLEGLVFARVRPGNVEFCGRVRNASSSLLAGLHPRNGLIRDPLTDNQLDEWRELIEELGREFLAGKAEVDPKDPAKTCERCNLHAVCRIGENQPLAGLMEDESLEPADEPGEAGGRDA